MVNAMFSDCHRSPRCRWAVAATAQLLARCTTVCAREPRSQRYAIEVLRLKDCRCLPDALFSWFKYTDPQWNAGNSRLYVPYGAEYDYALSGADLRGGYVCLSASSSAAWRPQQALPAYTVLIRELRARLNVPLLVVQTCQGENFLRQAATAGGGIFIDARIPVMQGFNLLAHAALYISGRWHPGIMAALGGTPCIFMKANSHKCLALQEQLGMAGITEYSEIPDAAEIISICEHAIWVLSSDTPQLRARRLEAARALALCTEELSALMKTS